MDVIVSTRNAIRHYLVVEREADTLSTVIGPKVVGSIGFQVEKRFFRKSISLLDNCSHQEFS